MLQLMIIFTLIGNVKSILIEVNNNIYNNIGVNNAEDKLSNYASEFHVAFLRQVNKRIEMIVLTRSFSPVQFNISSSTGYNFTGTTTANAATFVTIPSSLQVRESNYTYRHLGLHVRSSPS